MRIRDAFTVSHRDPSNMPKLNCLCKDFLTDWLLSWSMAAEDVPTKTPLDAASWMLAKWQWPSQGLVRSCMRWSFPRPRAVTAERWHLVGELPSAVPRPHSDFFYAGTLHHPSRIFTIQTPCLAHTMETPWCLLFKEFYFTKKYSSNSGCHIRLPGKFRCNL